jgi:hypothetical protein
MHHGIVLKVWGADEDEAHSQAASDLEDSVEASHNTVGWDYVSSESPILITKDRLQPDYKVKSYAELEQKMLRRQRESLDGLIKELKNDMLPILAPVFMTKTDAPLFIDTESDELKAYIEKLMKRKKDTIRPATFEEITDAVLKIMISVAKKDTGSSMAMWRMEHIKKMQACIEFPGDTSCTLQSNDNPYAELPYDGDKNGTSPYFYFADRHF